MMATKKTRDEAMLEAIRSPAFTRSFALQLKHGWFAGFDARGRVRRSRALAHALQWTSLAEASLIVDASRLLQKGLVFELVPVVPYIGHQPITNELLDMLPALATQTKARLG